MATQQLVKALARVFAAIALVTTVPGAAGAGIQAAEREFTSDRCEVAFRHAIDWIVRVDTMPSHAECQILVQAAAWDSLIIEADSLEEAYEVLIFVDNRPIDVMVDSSAFERRGRESVVGGRHGLEAPATAVEGNQWRGLRGLAPVVCYRIGGGYVGACELPMAVVGTDEHTAMLYGGPLAEDTFDRILATVVFRGATSRQSPPRL